MTLAALLRNRSKAQHVGPYEYGWSFPMAVCLITLERTIGRLKIVANLTRCCLKHFCVHGLCVEWWSHIFQILGSRLCTRKRKPTAERSFHQTKWFMMFMVHPKFAWGHRADASVMISSCEIPPPPEASWRKSISSKVTAVLTSISRLTRIFCCSQCSRLQSPRSESYSNIIT